MGGHLVGGDLPTIALVFSFWLVAKGLKQRIDETSSGTTSATRTLTRRWWWPILMGIAIAVSVLASNAIEVTKPGG